MSNTMANLKAYIKEKGIPIYIKTSVEAVASQEYTLDWNEDRSKCTIIMPRFSDDKRRNILIVCAFIVYLEYYFNTPSYQKYERFPIYKTVIKYKLRKIYKAFLKEQGIDTTDKEDGMIYYDIFYSYFPYNASSLYDVFYILDVILSFVYHILKNAVISFLTISFFAFYIYILKDYEQMTVEKLDICIKFIQIYWPILFVLITTVNFINLKWWRKILKS